MGSQLTKILCVDDAKMEQNLIRKCLGDRFELAFADDGQIALNKLDDFVPEIILLDLNMPNLCGIETCRGIRERHQYDDVPILFISSMHKDEDRLAAYRAGADDYLRKPIVQEELTHKIDKLLKIKAEKKALNDASAQATQTALTAMTGAAELGFVVALLRESFACKNISELGQKVFGTLSCYALDGSLMLKFDGKTHFFPEDKPLSDKEKQALIKAPSSGRIFKYQDIAIFSTPTVALLIRQMPADQEKTGRLRDHLAVLVEGVEARLAGLESEHRRMVEKQLLEQSIELTHGCLEELQEGHYSQRVDTAKILSDTAEDMEELFLRLGLDESQETALLELIIQAEQKTQDVFEKSSKLQKQFEEIEQHLNSLLENKSH